MKTVIDPLVEKFSLCSRRRTLCVRESFLTKVFCFYSTTKYAAIALKAVIVSENKFIPKEHFCTKTKIS